MSEEKTGWVKRVLGVDIADGADGGESSQDMVHRLTELLGEQMALAATLPDEAKHQFIEQAKAARALIGGPDLLAAEIAIEQLTAFREEAARKGRVGEAEGVTHKGRVAWLVLCGNWRSVQAQASTQIDQLKQMIRNDQRLENDPYREDALNAVDTVGEIVPQFGPDLEKLLTQLEDTTDEAEIAALRDEALDVLDAYVGELEDADILADVQTLAREEYGGSCNAYDALLNTLQDIRKTLASA